MESCSNPTAAVVSRSREKPSDVHHHDRRHSDRDLGTDWIDNTKRTSKMPRTQDVDLSHELSSLKHKAIFLC